jgi:hypothetical protein
VGLRQGVLPAREGPTCALDSRVWLPGGASRDRCRRPERKDDHASGQTGWAWGWAGGQSGSTLNGVKPFQRLAGGLIVRIKSVLVRSRRSSGRQRAVSHDLHARIAAERSQQDKHLLGPF